MEGLKRTTVLLGCLAPPVVAFPPGDEMFAAPTDMSAQASWLANLSDWRQQILSSISFNGSVYDNTMVNWSRTSYVQPQVHLFDGYLYDHVEHKYTVDRYLNDLDKRYGGIDSVLIWPTYPNIGIDARNQFDYFRALPGGLDGVRALTTDFKNRGVRVLWAYNPWDNGTRSEGEPHWTTLARLLKETGGDGFNGDTMTMHFREFWDAGVSIGYPFAGEMELWGGARPAADKLGPRADSWESFNWATMGWGYFNNDTGAYTRAPGVDKLKWLDGRHMTHVCNRWARNRTDDMQFAFFNGNGYESWENVWGAFNHFTEYDGEALKRVSLLLRWLGHQQFIQGYRNWEPYTPDLQRDPKKALEDGGLMASKFVHNSGDCVWLIINRGPSPANARIDVSGCAASPEDWSLFDLYHGTVLEGSKVATVAVEPNGYGAVLATPRDLPLKNLLAEMTDRRPLDSYSRSWEPLQQRMVGMSSDTQKFSDAPNGTVLVPSMVYDFRTAGVEIEGGCDESEDDLGICCKALGSYLCPDDPRCAEPCAFPGKDVFGIDVQFPWESTPHRFHQQKLTLGPFFMDKHLVTKGDYSEYLQTTGYTPRDAYNFLVGWKQDSSGALRPAEGEEKQPVVWVSMDEARAYCKWQGKRLPHAYEWQAAAQGQDGRTYPWGNTLDATRFPKPSNASEVPPLPDVGSFSPAGDSVYGMSDIVGHIWQFTDEFQDERTRGALLKGSSLFTPMLSDSFPAQPLQPGNWYFPKAQQLNRHNRLLLMDESFDRAGTLGFRCVADHVNGQPAPYHYSSTDRLEVVYM